MVNVCLNFALSWAELLDSEDYNFSQIFIISLP